MSLSLLMERMQYRFADESLLATALTHRSMGSNNNERLEFLGDAVLGLCIAEVLYRRDSRVGEGDLSRLRASLVNRDSLAELAADLDLGSELRLGGGELKSGGFRRDSILADALEAVIGAVYLDGGGEAAFAFIRRIYRDRLAALPSPDSLKDPKTRLQEALQGNGYSLPEYEVSAISGKEHDQRFHVSCRIPGTELGASGEGKSRRRAEQAAASKVLEQLTNDG